FSEPPDLQSFPTRRSSDLTVIQDVLVRGVNIGVTIVLTQESPCQRVIDTVIEQGEVRIVEVGVELEHSSLRQALAKRTYASEGSWCVAPVDVLFNQTRSEEHTSELQSRENLVCRL